MAVLSCAERTVSDCREVHGVAEAQANASLDRKEMNIEAVANQAPKPAWRFQHHGDRDRSERNEVPGAEVGEEEAQHEKHQGADYRPLDAADTADDHDEDDVRRPIGDAEGRGGRYPQLLEHDQASDQSRDQRRDEVDGQFVALLIDSDTAGGRF